MSALHRRHVPWLGGCLRYTRDRCRYMKVLTCTFIYCNVHTQMSVRPNAPALWMSSLHQCPCRYMKVLTCTFIYCNVHTQMSVRPNATAWWMSSLHQCPCRYMKILTCTCIYCNVHTQASVRPNAPAWWMSSLHQGSLSPYASNHMYIYLFIVTYIHKGPYVPRSDSDTLASNCSRHMAHWSDREPSA